MKMTTQYRQNKILPKYPSCSKCEHNGKCDSACLSCTMPESYSYKYRHYILDTYDPPAPDTSGSEPVTNLDEDSEDKFRKALCDIFALRPIELLFIQSIMNHRTLTEFANDINEFVDEMHNRKNGMTRFSAFQLKKLIIKKLPYMSSALITEGQRKPIKHWKEQPA